MSTMSLATALEVLGRRNAELASAYKVVSRKSLSRALQGLATSAAEQRRKMAEEMAALVASLSDSPISVNLDPPEAFALPVSASCDEDAKALLTLFLKAEKADKELFESLAQQTSGAQDTSAHLSAWSEQARKRASVASDHLDLLAL